MSSFYLLALTPFDILSTCNSCIHKMKLWSLQVTGELGDFHLNDGRILGKTLSTVIIPWRFDLVFSVFMTPSSILVACAIGWQNWDSFLEHQTSWQEQTFNFMTKTSTLKSFVIWIPAIELVSKTRTKIWPPLHLVLHFAQFKIVNY